MSDRSERSGGRRKAEYCCYLAFEKLSSRENELGLMANATEMPSFKMLCTNNNEFTGGGGARGGDGRGSDI